MDENIKMKKWILKLLKRKQKSKKKTRIEVIVFTNNEREAERYFKLFVYLLKSKFESAIFSNGRKEITASDMRVRFLSATENARGHRAHYVFNLTQNKEFDMCVARAIESPWYLDKLASEDPIFKSLL